MHLTFTQRFKFILTSLFIAFHLITIFSLAFPPMLSVKTLINQLTLPYTSFFGISQYWAMFANPAPTNLEMNAIIIFKDGTQKTWDFPAMEKLSLTEKFLKFRFHKWAYDHVYNDADKAIWPATSRYIASTFSNPKNSPTEVKLIRKWAEVRINPNNQIEPAQWKSFTFHVEKIQATDSSYLANSIVHEGNP